MNLFFVQCIQWSQCKKMKREYYSDSIANFQKTSPDEILGILARYNDFSIEPTQRNAWLEEINILQKELSRFEGTIYFE